MANNMPQSLAEWRSRFANGLTWSDVEEAHTAGLMNDERYHYLFDNFTRNGKTEIPANQIQDPSLSNWRCFWEPKESAFKVCD